MRKAHGSTPSCPTNPTLGIRSVDEHSWQNDVDPLVARLVAAVDSRLHRHRAKIGRWVVEYVGDSETAHQFFSDHWTAAHPGETPDAYCYHFCTGADPDGTPLPAPLATVRDGEGRASEAGDSCGRDSSAASATFNPDRQSTSPLPRAMICPAIGRAILLNSHRYAHVLEVCLAILRQLSLDTIQINQRQELQKESDACWVLPGACAEYQADSGMTRSTVILGPQHVLNTLLAYSLACAKPQNGLLGTNLTCLNVALGTASSYESRFWWPTTMASLFPRLVACLATSSSEDLSLPDELMDEIRKYRDVSDLARAIENGLFPEQSFARLTEQLARASGAYAMVDARNSPILPHHLQQTQLTDLILILHDPLASWLLRVVPPDEFISHIHTCGAADESFGKARERSVRAQRACLDHLFCEKHVRPALANARLAFSQTQFCLRHYFEGLCDSIRLLSAIELAGSGLIQAMRLDIRDIEQPSDSGQPCPAVFHGTRTVHVVSLEKDGHMIEAAAFDPTADGYAQVRSVWPGQVADFFSRHAGMHVRELFIEARNRPLSWR